MELRREDVVQMGVVYRVLAERLGGVRLELCAIPGDQKGSIRESAERNSCLASFLCHFISAREERNGRDFCPAFLSPSRQAMPSYSSTEAQMARSGYTKAVYFTWHWKLRAPCSLTLTAVKFRPTKALPRKS